MERVQFQQEQMLDELKDLVERGLFTAKETSLILKKRTSFETLLIRRVPKKSDFLRYAAYEMGLERLQRKRAARLDQNPAPATISSYSLVRRQFHIFERALKKFKGDVGLWVQYINLAKKEGARALVGRVCARALQLHPSTPSLYILAAAHELTQLSPASARTLLQRGLRMNGGSVELWREYVKMELGWVESLRRRWGVLGIGGKDGEGEEARKEIMEGGIVKSVISSAAKALPTFPLFSSLHTLVLSYPCPPTLRRTLLTHLHTVLLATLPHDPEAVALYATNLDGEELVERLREANARFVKGVESHGMYTAYASFVQKWWREDVDVNLRLYLVSSLQSLTSRITSGTLFSTHINLLLSPLHPSPPEPERILKIARRYSKKTPRDAGVWLARLEAEKQSGQDIEVVWTEAKGQVADEDVWKWGLDPRNSGSGPREHADARATPHCT